MQKTKTKYGIKKLTLHQRINYKKGKIRFHIGLQQIYISSNKLFFTVKPLIWEIVATGLKFEGRLEGTSKLIPWKARVSLILMENAYGSLQIQDSSSY